MLRRAGRASAVYEWNYARADDRNPARRSAANATATTVDRDIFAERLPAQAARCCRRIEARPRRAGAAHRRARSQRRGVRGLSAGNPRDFQITIPEIGTIKAEQPPIVIITSNRTREVHDALKRRCLYYWIDYPDRRERARDRPAKVPGRRSCSRAGHAFVQELREPSSTSPRRRRDPRLGHRADRLDALAEPQRSTIPSACC